MRAVRQHDDWQRGVAPAIRAAITNKEVLPCASTQAQLVKHAQTLFGAATAKGEDMKRRDWGRFLSLQFPDGAPDLSSMQWPPGREEWLEVVKNSRARVGTHRRHKGWLSNIVHTACKYFARVRECSEASLDPRQLYQSDPLTLMSALKREYGVGVRQVVGITIREANDGPFVLDPESISECAKGAAWTLGTVCGGRRPRSVAGVRVSDLEMTVESMTVSGKRVLVPAVSSITWREEKTTDYSGPRKSSDTYYASAEEDWEFIKTRPAYWIYRLLALRGIWQGKGSDPIAEGTVRAGDKLSMRAGTGEYFLICDCRADSWCDSMPVSVNMLGAWTKDMLIRMGRPARCYSAHRRGSVTRAVILEMHERKGRALSDDILRAVARWGGWDCVNGVNTLLKVYASKITDLHLDGSALGLGRRATTQEIEARRAAYVGSISKPNHSVHDKNKMAMPLSLRVQVWNHPEVAALRACMTKAVSRLLQLAELDLSLLPVRRYREHRDVYVKMMKKYTYSRSAERGSTEDQEACKLAQSITRDRRQIENAMQRAANAIAQGVVGIFQERAPGTRLSHAAILQHRVAGVCVGRLPWGAAHGLQAQPIGEGVRFLTM